MTERVTQGKKFTAEFKEFTKKRIEIERDYAKKLQSLIKSTKITEIGCVFVSRTSSIMTHMFC